ncbi:MAG: type 1 glutamine amidotransferase domain-containing protein [Verrucomicrobiales bacterium]|nr:type 1 glutamine amidotransferase domain-containing protein [Verrucomicrobiales bacterium]
MRPKHILAVVANPATSSTLGVPVGFWASELIHPYDAMTRAGHRVTIASPKGGAVALDAYSDPRDSSGYSREDTLSLAYLENPDFVNRLANTPSTEALSPDGFDAILVVGGQSPMFTFRHNPPLQALFLGFLDAGKPGAALCHGTCLLLDLKDRHGVPVIRGRRMTGFANSEEDVVDGVVGRKVMPFRIEDEARSLGAHFLTAGPFEPFAVRDGNLITGQQQHSGNRVAELVLQALEEVP